MAADLRPKHIERNLLVITTGNQDHLFPEAVKTGDGPAGRGSNGVIVVTTKASESNVSANGENDFEVNRALIIVDGKEISYEEFAKLKPESRTEYTEKFANMEILRPGSEEAKAYGEKGRNGVVIATTKAAQKKKK